MRLCFGSSLRSPRQARPGGTLVMGEWQAASQLNPFFTTAFTNFEALGPALRGLVQHRRQGKWVPDLGGDVPTPENGGLVHRPERQRLHPDRDA